MKQSYNKKDKLGNYIKNSYYLQLDSLISVWFSCSTFDRRRSERSMASPGTSIDCSALMNASVRRLTSLSLGVQKIGVKAACTSLKRSFATLGVVIAAVVLSQGRSGGSGGSGGRDHGGERGSVV